MLDLKELKKEYMLLPGDHDAMSIQRTADELKGFNYSPDIPFKVDDFYLFTKEKMLKELDRVDALSKSDLINMGFNDEQKHMDIKVSHLNMLLYHYKILLKLRDNETSAWDKINEWYEED